MRDRNIDRPRVDEWGRAYKGSQLQIQLYVNRYSSHLEAELRKGLPSLEGKAIDWRAPIAADWYREPSDGGFLRLVGLAKLLRQAEAFWPKGGPVWDGVATYEAGEKHGVLLLEGKNYPSEAHSAWRAKAPESRRKIQKALDATRAALGAIGDGAAWTDRYYQVANRLAWLRWLQDHDVCASLAYLCFTDDARHGATTRPEWDSDLRSTEDALGVSFGKIPGLGVVHLPARPDRHTDLPRAATTRPGS